jgi:hypothetical protein
MCLLSFLFPHYPHNDPSSVMRDRNDACRNIHSPTSRGSILTTDVAVQR